MTERNDIDLTPVKVYTKKELAQLYGISVDTLMVWLKPYLKDLRKMKYRSGQRLLTVSQVKFLFKDENLGRP